MKILVCPLNWGLGHATRCIPLINQWINEGHEIVIATDGNPLSLLIMQFPLLRKIEFSSYNIRYSSGKSQTGAMFISLPAIISGIINEHFWLKKLLRKEHFDRVVSDNRFGLWSKKTESIYITHQVRVKMPRELKWFEPVLAALHRLIINRYDYCYVPDYQGADNLSGELSHTSPLPTNVQFIGPLSRFKNLSLLEGKLDYEQVIVVSGPEPQRTIFENEMTDMAIHSGLKTLLVRGLPASTEMPLSNNLLHKVNHLPDALFATVLMHCNTIYCRSGYSSIMDLEALNCLPKTIFIPTPGQTEQEYLAEYHAKKAAEEIPRGR